MCVHVGLGKATCVDAVIGVATCVHVCEGVYVCVWAKVCVRCVRVWVWMRVWVWVRTTCRYVPKMTITTYGAYTNASLLALSMRTVDSSEKL